MPNGSNRTVLVTGASSGIGKATALYLAEKGYSVIGTSRSMTRLDGLRDEASKKGLTLSTIELDINDDDAVAHVFSSQIGKHRPVDVLVNNAGYGLWGPIESLTLAEIRAQFETNFFAAVRLMKAVLPEMISQRKGTIVNISSIEGRVATPFNAAYASSKFALEGLSEALRIELWPLGIRVCLVEPGLIHTGFSKNQVVGAGTYTHKWASSPYVEKYKAKHARFEWLAGDPHKVAKVIYRIACSRRPAFRYPVGPEARLGMLGARLLPERFFQAMVSRATIR